ncbi:MAG: hypothetical protein AAGC55_14505, partial [Myxococcota bacterium]
YGTVVTIHRERWGVVESLRVEYVDGIEFEFTIGAQNWANMPLDSGTLAVLSKGARVLYDTPNNAIKCAIDAAQDATR